MNFHYMPELQWHHGYAFVVTLMLVVALSIVALFKLKRWA